jgi:dTDP-4-amino-4,6-dideoxygalactose transaminase
VNKLNVSRDRICEALIAEGVDGLGPRYMNLHMLPMYQQKIAYGSQGFPWTSDICHRDVDYLHGICPVAEELQEKSYLGFAMCLNDLDDRDVDLIVTAFRKVWNSMDEIRKS